MRIAVDFSAVRVGAGVVYATNLLASLVRIDRSNQYWIFLPSGVNILQVELPANFRAIRWAPRSAAIRVPFFQSCLPLWLRKERIDVILSPNEYSIVVASSPIVLGMQNLSPYVGLPASTFAGRLRNRMIRSLARVSARRAARIFFLSDASRRVICAELEIQLAKTVIIPCGLQLDSLYAGGEPAAHLSAVADRHAQGPYILSISAVQGHKDFHSLVRGFAALIHRHGILHVLLIAGPLTDRVYLTRLQSLIRELELQQKVFFLGEIPHDQIGFLYSRADLMVLPSWAETFGMPLIEAMACGVPVIASDLPALREVGTQAVQFYSPGDWNGLCDLLHRVIIDHNLRTSMLAAGKARAADFSWDKAAQQTLALLHEAVAEKRQQVLS